MQANHHQDFELLCFFLAQEHSGSKNTSYTKSEIKSIDWERIFQLADGYLVIPALYLNLRRKGYLTLLDKEACKFLEVIYELNYEHNHLLKEEALSVIRLLNSKNIRPVLLKGIAGLLSGLYEDDGERIIGDVDLLVDQSELITVVELLLNYGYRCDQDVCDQVFGGRFFRHELTIISESGLVKIDLHVRLMGSSGAKAFISAEESKTDAEVIKLGKANAILPSPIFRLMHNFYHAQHLDRSFLSGRIDLRQLIDWVTLLSLYRDDAWLTKANGKARVYRKITSLNLYLLNAWVYLGSPKPKDIKLGRIVRLLFQRQEISIRNSLFASLNRGFLYFATGALLFSPEILRLKYGNLSLPLLIVLRVKTFLSYTWYLRRLNEMKGLPWLRKSLKV